MSKKIGFIGGGNMGGAIIGGIISSGFSNASDILVYDKNSEALKNHLIANEIDVTEDNRIPNAKRFHFFDPFGNRIEIIEWILD